MVLRSALFFLIVLSLASEGAIGQELPLSDYTFATKETEKLAKKNTQRLLDSLTVELDLSKKPRTAKFELTPCVLFTVVEKDDGLNSTPAGNFPKIEGCPGSYFYVLRSNKSGSHYLIHFFYNEEGTINAYEIAYYMVTR